jgi:hypothetical protein
LALALQDSLDVAQETFGTFSRFDVFLRRSYRVMRATLGPEPVAVVTGQPKQEEKKDDSKPKENDHGSLKLFESVRTSQPRFILSLIFRQISAVNSRQPRLPAT